MKYIVRKAILFLCLYSFTIVSPLLAQSPDEYFQQARTQAFEHKNYAAAIQLSKTALELAPSYTDISAFLGKLYFWTNKNDSAKMVLLEAYQTNPAHEELTMVLADIELTNQQNKKALAIVEAGLLHHPNSNELMMRKIKALAALQKNKQAINLAEKLLKSHQENEAIKSLLLNLNKKEAKNTIGITYDYTYFSHQFPNPWQLVSLDYTRHTQRGSATARLSYANRYAASGLQMEVDAYPKINRNFYAYLNFAYSADMPIFPNYRAGLSLFAKLPKGFEVDGGFRYLYFNDPTLIYTFSASKYLRQFWFNARTYLSPGADRINQSYLLSARMYTKEDRDFFTFSLGRGISPDDKTQVIQFNNKFNLITNRIGAGYRFTFRKMNAITLQASFENVEYQPSTKSNQVNCSFNYQRSF